MIKKFITLVCFMLVFTGAASAQSAGYKTVNAEEFKSLMEKEKGVLIDLRTPGEIEKGKIKGATEIDFLATDIEARIDSLDKSKIYYVYCAGGGRSADCSEMMVKKGFKHVVNLQKGFSEWKKAGFEIETK